MSFEATVQALAARHGSNVTHPDIVDRGFKACARGQTELINLLLAQFGTSWINELSATEAQSPVYAACRRGELPILQHLIDATNSSLDYLKGFTTSFYGACAGGNLDVVKLALQPETDINKGWGEVTTPLSVAAETGNLELVQYLLSLPGIDVNKGECTPLSLAASKGFVEIVKVLLNVPGVNINGGRRTALDLAVAEGQLEVVQILSQQTGIILPPAGLFFCGTRGYLEIAKLLVELGLDVNSLNADKISGLYTATYKGHAELVQWLLAQENIDPNLGAWSPLLGSCESNNEETLALILAHPKADVNKPSGYTNEAPLTYAVRTQKNDSIIKLLLNANATPNTDLDKEKISSL